MNIKTINIIFSKKEQKMKFIAGCALTFGLKLETLSKIFNMDESKLLLELTTYNPDLNEYLYTLFNRGIVDQNKALKEFMFFYIGLERAYLKHNKKQFESLLRVLEDNEAMKLKSEHKKWDVLNEKELMIILKYQLKYMLDIRSIADFFNICRTTYSKNIHDLKDKYPEEVAQFDYINDYHFLNYKSKVKGKY